MVGQDICRNHDLISITMCLSSQSSYPPLSLLPNVWSRVHRPRPPSSHLSLRPLARYFIRATLIINPVKLSIAMINNLFSLGMGWTRLLIIEEYLIRFAISAISASRPCPQMACAPISWRRKLISNLTSASHRNPARQKPARTVRSLHKLYQALLHKSIQHHIELQLVKDNGRVVRRSGQGGQQSNHQTPFCPTCLTFSPCARQHLIALV